MKFIFFILINAKSNEIERQNYKIWILRKKNKKRKAKTQNSKTLSLPKRVGHR